MVKRWALVRLGISSLRKYDTAQLNRNRAGIAERSLNTHALAVGDTTEIGLELCEQSRG